MRRRCEARWLGTALATIAMIYGAPESRGQASGGSEPGRAEGKQIPGTRARKPKELPSSASPLTMPVPGFGFAPWARPLDPRDFLRGDSDSASLLARRRRETNGSIFDRTDRDPIEFDGLVRIEERKRRLPIA
jgi:hypothetical protein